jgi:hypothetical protein
LISFLNALKKIGVEPKVYRANEMYKKGDYNEAIQVALKNTEKIKEIAKRLLGEKKVDLVIGHRKGSIVLKNAPYFAYTPQDADRLIWDGNCRNNPANFLIPYKDKRVAIIAQGCVSRNVVGLIFDGNIESLVGDFVGVRHRPGASFHQGRRHHQGVQREGCRPLRR